MIGVSLFLLPIDEHCHDFPVVGLGLDEVFDNSLELLSLGFLGEDLGFEGFGISSRFELVGAEIVVYFRAVLKGENFALVDLPLHLLAENVVCVEEEHFLLFLPCLLFCPLQSLHELIHVFRFLAYRLLQHPRIVCRVLQCCLQCNYLPRYLPSTRLPLRSLPLHLRHILKDDCVSSVDRPFDLLNELFLFLRLREERYAFEVFVLELHAVDIFFHFLDAALFEVWLDFFLHLLLELNLAFPKEDLPFGLYDLCE